LKTYLRFICGIYINSARIVRMTGKAIFVNLFNEKAEEFCKDLVTTFPDVAEFRKLKSSLLLLKNVDERKPREFFNNYVGAHFKHQILAKDESFFINEAQNRVQGGLDNSQWHNVIGLIHDLWGTLSNENKENIWKYFQVLIAINDKC
jgi:hypothetical protein